MRRKTGYTYAGRFLRWPNTILAYNFPNLG